MSGLRLTMGIVLLASITGLAKRMKSPMERSDEAYMLS
jgi:hypothetical protein